MSRDLNTAISLKTTGWLTYRLDQEFPGKSRCGTAVGCSTSHGLLKQEAEASVYHMKQVMINRRAVDRASRVADRHGRRVSEMPS
ncbi:MAG: hypothetical protein QXS54_06065 [Candidatus Methanomethylicaceae archaeon]